jgi:protein SCO1/2
VRRIADAVGFHYTYDEKTGEYGHPAAVIVLTPDGRVSRYLLGLGLAARDLRLAVREASGATVGSLADRVMLLCYHFDATTGRYTAQVARLAKVVGALSMVLVGGLLWRSGRPREVPA